MFFLVQSPPYIRLLSNQRNRRIILSSLHIKNKWIILKQMVKGYYNRSNYPLLQYLFKFGREMWVMICNIAFLLICVGTVKTIYKVTLISIHHLWIVPLCMIWWRERERVILIVCMWGRESTGDSYAAYGMNIKLRIK